MNKVIAFLIITIGIVGAYKLTSNPQTVANTTGEADVILFWGNGCPHCETVKKYISDNKVDSQLKIDQKEIYYNQENKKLLDETVKKCPNLDTSNGVGIPLAFVQKTNQCFVGDTPIIDFFKSAKTEVK